MNREHAILFASFEEKILNLIDNRDELTRGDLQGMTEALVRKIYTAGANSQLK